MQKKDSFSQRHNNLFRYPVGQDAKLYAEAKKKISESELHSLVADNPKK
jgi:hypothetical protein